MQNSSELRKQLSEVFEGLKDDKITPEKASQFANLAGKIINSANVQVKYYALKKETPSIPFLDE